MSPVAYTVIALGIVAVILPFLFAKIRAWHPILRLRRRIAFYRLSRHVPDPVQETDRPRVNRETELLRKRQQEAVEEANEWLRAAWRARFK